MSRSGWFFSVVLMAAVSAGFAGSAQAQRGHSQGRSHDHHDHSRGSSHDHHGHSQGHHGHSQGHHGHSSGHHLHPHGDHFDVHRNVPHGHDAAGHLIDRYGHHIDGHGHHTGSVGVYEDGSRSVPYSRRWSGYYGGYSGYPYYSPYYSTPLYSGSLYSGSLYSNPLYSSPLYASPLSSSSLYADPQYAAPLYAAPSANAAPGAANNPIPAPGRAALGSTFVLSNPRDSGGPIRYSLNSFTYTINPGEIQTVQLDRDWVIKFDNGMNQTVSYRMDEGHYEFTVTPDKGWDLVKRTTQPPAAAAGANAVPGRRAL